MSDHQTDPTPVTVPPPSKHQLALMIWIAVVPTLIGLNLVLGKRLSGLPTAPRTFVLATLAVPIVIYGLMPRLHRVRARLIAGRAGGQRATRGFSPQEAATADIP